MSTVNELAEQIKLLYPLQDKQQGIRYRVVDELAGTTELEAVTGQPRYVPTHSLQDSSRWQFQV
ncbi:hypothetical protein TOI97_02175 [Denitrificimonas sp. JX-1]|uniref:Uncharacterized protein n=1 Tax=Denitrificimonas halotolerans TaxID=3098930 RepID=A0ABU5GN55_9GAMM|nr:hypothetical protein [Denitrificimonas sp. JX-1]MDY7218390.1 hypothetical protein [Denitrificimonas sp. JX-1]